MSTPSFYARISFQAKVLIPVIGTLVLLMCVVMWLVNLRLTNQLRSDAESQLAITGKVFTNSQALLSERFIAQYETLAITPRVFAALNTMDPDTVTDSLSDLVKHDKDAGVMVFSAENGLSIASLVLSSQVPPSVFEAQARTTTQRAMSGRSAVDQIEVGSKLYQVISVPVSLPPPSTNVPRKVIGAMTFGIEMGANLATRIKGLTQSDILFIANNAPAGSSFRNKTNDVVLVSKYLELLAKGEENPGLGTRVVLNGEPFLCKAEQLSTGGGKNGYLLLYSLKAPLESLESTRSMLMWIGVVGILVAGTTVWLVVNLVTKPLRQLRKGVEAVGRGNYASRVEVNSRDECGELASVFNKMTANVQSSREELERALQTLKATQHQLIQSEKLSGIGEFVAGVAHELNNPLTTVMGYSELLQHDTQIPETHRRYMESVFLSARRCQKIVQSLLSFSRKHAPERKVVCVHEVIQSALDILAYQMRTSNIEVETAFDPALPPSSVDPHQLQQVFLNLINNARQAMEGKQACGQLRISTERKGDRVLVVFRDNGPGIAAENLSKIFNPFFTTKEVGKGTGLGLSICYGIVTEHGGTITPLSPAGEGATFIVELPASTEPSVGLDPAVAAAPNNPREGLGKRVLVIDDEQSILQMIQQVLGSSGYQVDVASNGTIGLERIRQFAYDLILCDLKMPGIGGQQVYESLYGFNPELARKLVFITGDLINESTQAYLSARNKSCLAKPFTIGEFRTAVHGVIHPF